MFPFWSTNMQKVPSYLKGLAETRARVDAECSRLEQLHADIGQRLAEAQAERDACDRLIKKYDGRLDPTTIAPIKARQGRYGKRGGLKQAVLEVVAMNFPVDVTTSEIAWAIQLRFDIGFETPDERQHWLHHSVGGALHTLTDKGLVKPLHDQSIVGGTGRTGRWLLVVPTDSIEGLTAMATSAGMTTAEATDFVADEEPSEADGLPS
jgi:hypothetical protein